MEDNKQSRQKDKNGDGLLDKVSWKAIAIAALVLFLALDIILAVGVYAVKDLYIPDRIDVDSYSLDRIADDISDIAWDMNTL